MNHVRRLAELAVGLGANVQPGQTVRLSAESGQEPTIRAIAEAAYRRGARFVDVNLFDPLVQRARIAHGPSTALDEIPQWEVARLRELGLEPGASIKVVGPGAPDAFDDLDPADVARATLPTIPQWRDLESVINWTVVPSATPGWARALRPELDEDDAMAALWDDLTFACRLDEDDPAAAWRNRLEQLRRRAEILNAVAVDVVRFRGPGTDLRIGLLPGARWEHPVMVSDRGIAHVPNLPTEEVFTVPDPARVDGHARLTRPAVVGGRRIHDVTLHFAGGRLAAIAGGPAAEALRVLAARDHGASRLGEVALVDDSGRVGRLGRSFGVILLDENAASHIALGYGFPELVASDDRERVNSSAVHLDLMIGAANVEVTVVTRDGRELPLVREGRWAETR